MAGILSTLSLPPLAHSFASQSPPYPLPICSGPGCPTRSFTLTGIRPPLSRSRKAKPQLQELNGQLPEPEEEIKVLTAVESNYNSIVIVDTPDSRVLLLDSTHNVHSVLNKGDEIWTQSYWDEFVTLPAIVPEGGPIAMFGLGGGTAAKLMLEVWPSLRLEGWEIDEILIHKARQYLGLEDLEKGTESGGILEIRIGDALSPSSTVAGGYAGIVVDLFGNGKVLPELEEAKTWVEMREKLMPGGRIMVNCGGVSSNKAEVLVAGWERNYALRAMKETFGGGELHWKKIPANEDRIEMEYRLNFMALTGALPDLASWVNAFPPQHRHFLRSSVHQWRTC